MVRILVAPGKWQLAEEDILIDEREYRSEEHAQLVQARTEITATVQFLVDPGCVDAFFVVTEFRLTRVSGRQRLVDAFCRQHAGLDRSVCPFDLHPVQKSGATANQHAARKPEFGQ